jgi:hypothetical protein
MSLPIITSIDTESNSFRIHFTADDSPPAGAHTNSITLFMNEKNNTDYTFPIYTIFECSIAAEDDIPDEFLIELEDPPQFNVGATYVMSISQSFSDGSETVSNTYEKDYGLNAKPLKPVIYDASGNDVAAGDQVVSFYLDTGASQGSAVLSITGRSFNVAAGQYVTHQCPINSATLTRAGSSGMKMKVRKTIVGDPEHADNLYYCVLLNLENGVHYEHRFSTINAVGKSESCNVFTSTPTNEVLAVTGFALDSSIMDYRFTASWNALTIPNHDDFESRVTGYKLDYEYTDAFYDAVTATFDASSNTLLTFESQPLNLAEAASGVSIVNGFPTSLTSAQMALAKADSNPTLITAGADQDGWTIDNAGGVADASGNYPKVNLYFYAADLDASGNLLDASGNNLLDASGNLIYQTGTNSFTLNDATGLGLYAIFDQAAGAKEYPFFNAYTTFSGANNRDSWYKSKVFYGPQSNNGDTLANADNVGLTLAYTGADNDNGLFPHIPSARRIKYEVKTGDNLTDANTGYASEFINYLTLKTSSQDVSAGNYNFRLLETGMFTSHASFGQLRLLYNLTGKVAATIYATTDNSGDGALSAVQSIRVLDNPLGLRSQDYTITAEDEAIRVDIALNAATLAYLSNRSELTHIVISVLDANYNVLQDVSYNIVNNTLILNHTFAALNNGNSYIIRMHLVARNPNPSESTEVIDGEVVYVPNIVPLATGDAVLATATGSDQKVAFSWSAVTEEQLQGGTFVKYVIKYRGSSGTDVIHQETDISGNSYDLTGLTNGTTYYFTFYMVTLDPNTSSEVNGDATDLEQIPFRAADAPTEITLYPGDEEMLVDWPEAVLNGSNFDSYWVALFSGEVGSGTFDRLEPRVLTSSHTFTGLTNGTSYYATVTVFTTNPNNVNVMDQMQGGSITSSSKIPFDMPYAPSVVEMVADDEEMRVEWSTAELNGSDFTNYLVELFNADGVLVSSVFEENENTTYHTFTGLTNGTQYYASVTVNATNPNNGNPVTSDPTTYTAVPPLPTPFGEPGVPTLAYYPGYQTIRVVWSNVNTNGGPFEKYKVQLHDSSGNNLMQPEVVYTDVDQNTHTFTDLTIGVNYIVKVIVVTSDPNAAPPAAGGDPIDGQAGSITAAPHDNPIIIGSATIDNAAGTVSVTVDKNGSEITDYMAIVQPGNLMQKINDSTPVANSDGTFTLSMTFNTVSITSALMVVGNGRGFTAVEFNGSTQTVLSEQHYRAVAQP